MLSHTTNFSGSQNLGRSMRFAPPPASHDLNDTLDIMGIPHAGHFNAFQKECLPPGPTSPWMRPRSTTILTRRWRSPRCGPTAAARGSA